MALASWIDNLYAFSTDPHKAIATLEAIEGNLQNDWGVKFKPSSLMIMQPRGARLCDDLGERWIRVHTLPVLGHLVSDNASLHADWNALKKSLWRAFWANAGSASIRHTDSPLKMRLIDRAVTCIASYRWSRWAPQRQLAKDIDRVQAYHASLLLFLCIIQCHNHAFETWHTLLLDTCCWAGSLVHVGILPPGGPTGNEM